MSYKELGSIIRVARTAVGLDQSDLARKMGLRQQAVSTWERGGSRPRESMLPLLADTLNLEIDVLRAVGRYEVVPTAGSGQPRLRTLPFEQLSDDAFEGFVRDLMHGLHPTWAVSRNGSRGYKQFGVDVFAIGVGDDERIGVQCKHQKNFGASDVAEAVKAVTSEANVARGLIALSRTTATPQARIAVHKHPTWELWDGEDLALRVRDLPLDKQLVLIDIYFPRSREDFLGISEPSPWVNVSEQHNGFAGTAGYDSTFPLTGRGPELARLRGLTTGSHNVVFVVGNGGIGKSRLLAEYALSEQDREVRFAPRGVVQANMFDRLPAGAPVVILDDLLEPDATLLDTIAGIRRARPDAMVVLSLRPRVVEHWCSRLDIATESAVELTVKVGDLSISDAEALARLALGENETEERIVELLARAGYDCPLIIVLGAHLYREGNVSSLDLASRDGLRKEVLKAFADSLTSDSGGALTDVLAAVAAVQPVRLEQPEFVAAIEQLAPHSRSALKAIDQLEDRGLILRRGQIVRIVPDLLGEAVLEDSLVARSGPTGFATRLASSLTGVALAQALRNVSIIDWYRRARGESQLASQLWDSLVDHALTLGNRDRIGLIDAVEPVAAIHAEQALRFARSLLENPASDEKDELSRLFGGDGLRTTDHVKRELAKLLRNASHDPAVMAECMRMLLEFGKCDDRPENQNPDHPWRLLRELGEYGLDRPLSFNERYIDVVSSWLHDGTLTDLRPSLFRFLSSLLADDFTLTRWKAQSLQFSRVPVDQDNVAPLRARVIDLAGEFLSAGPLVACAAVTLLEDALQSVRNVEAVSAETKRVFDMLEKLLADSVTHPSVRVTAYRALGWHASYGAGAHRARARQLRRSAFIDADFPVVRSIRGGIATLSDDDDDDDVEYEEGSDNGVESTAKRVSNRYRELGELESTNLRSAAERWAGTYSAAESVDHLLTLLRIEQQVADHVSWPDLLVASLVALISDFASTVLSIQAEDDPAVWATKRAALAAWFMTDESSALVEARRLMENATGALVVAQATVSNLIPSLSDGMVRLVDELIDTRDPEVSRTLLAGLRWRRPPQVDLLVHIIRVAPIDKDSAVAQAVAATLVDSASLTWGHLPQPEREIVMEKFARTPRLDDYAHGQLLSRVLLDDPAWVLNLLMARIDHSSTDTERYEALPHGLDSTLSFFKVASYAVLLRQAVEWAIDGERWRHHYFEIKNLLELLAKPVGDEVLALVLELFKSGEKDRLSIAGMLLGEASRHFVIEQRQFVADAVAIAADLPEEPRRSILHSLHSPSIYGIRSGSVGVDDPEEAALRDAARNIAAELPDGTGLRAFYEDASGMAGQRIIEDRARDLEMFDTRQW